jgi:hypothetical protein
MLHNSNLYICSIRYHHKMTNTDYEDRHLRTLDEICENTRAIRRVTNRILDQMHKYNAELDQDYDPDNISWRDLDNMDDMYS